MFRSHFLCASVLALTSSAFAGSVASQVLNYVPGDANVTFQNTNAAVGLPSGDTGFGALTPFNPHFSANELLIVGKFGSVTLQLDKPISIIPGAALGVFSNVGIIDEDPDTQFAGPPFFETIAGGRGIAGNPAGTFSAAGFGFVSVSSNGTDWTPLSANPFSFTNPTNYYKDTDISLNFAPLGTQQADFFDPFTGNLSNFAGLRYRDAAAQNDIVRMLDGSAGGTWLDLSLVPLAQVNYVKFDVPADGRIVLDAVTAIPEPSTLGMIGLATLALKRRRNR